MVSGSEGAILTILQAASGAVFVTGALEPELRALSGATVQLTGARNDQGGRVSVDVKDYEVVDIDGERPVVGRVVAGNRLAVGRDTLNIRGTVNAPVGAKIWITGDRSGTQLTVRSYGIIIR
jgi:hypothetical protein